MWPWLGGCDLGETLSREGPLSCHIFCNQKLRRSMYDNRWTLRIYPNPCSPWKLNDIYWYHQKWYITIHNILSVDWLDVVLRIPSKKLPSLWRETKLSSLLLPNYGFVLDTLDRTLLPPHGTSVLGPPWSRLDGEPGILEGFPRSIRTTRGLV